MIGIFSYLQGPAGFIIFSALMVGGLLLLIVPAFLRLPTPHNDISNSNSNVAVARERLQDLHARIAAGEITATQAAEYEDEIRGQLLNDVNDPSSLAAPARHRRDFLGAGLVLVLMVAAIALYANVGRFATLFDSQPLDIDTVAANLEQAVTDQPGNTIFLIGLARINEVQKDYASASRHYARARAIIGDRPDLLSGNINALLNLPNPDFNEIDRLLELALATGPHETSVLWLAGLVAEHHGNFDDTLDYWQRAYAGMADNPKKRFIADVITTAQQRQLGEPLNAAEVNLATKLIIEFLAPDPGVSVAVRMGDGVAVTSPTPLFIFAKATGPNAPQIPLAVLRSTATHLPLVVNLNDSSAMTPATKMSDFAAYDIVARLSATGKPTAVTGDWFGTVAGIAAGTTVTIVIDQQVP